jgi:hypothetical protein
MSPLTGVQININVAAEDKANTPHMRENGQAKAYH